MPLKFEQNPTKLWHGMTREDTARHEKARQGTRRHGKVREGTGTRAQGTRAQGTRAWNVSYSCEYFHVRSNLGLIGFEYFLGKNSSC